MIYSKDGLIKIESLKKEQIEELRKMRNLPDVWKNLSNPFEINELEQERWFTTQSLDPSKQYFTLMIFNPETTEFDMVGCVWYDEWDRTNSSCRVGLFIHPYFHRRKIGKRSLEAFIEFLQKDMNIHRIWLLVMRENKIAKKLYDRLGFLAEGIQFEAIFRNGVWHDYVMMSLLRRENG